MKKENDKSDEILAAFAEQFSTLQPKGNAGYEKNPELAYRAVRQRMQILNILKITRFYLFVVTLVVFCFSNVTTGFSVFTVSLLITLFAGWFYRSMLRDIRFTIPLALADEWISYRKLLCKHILHRLSGSSDLRSNVELVLVRMLEDMIRKEEVLDITGADTQKTKIKRLIDLFQKGFHWTYDFGNLVRKAKENLAGEMMVNVRVTVGSR